MVGPWLLPTCDWWLRAIRSPANTHWACTKVAEEEKKRKFHLFSKSSFEREAIKREGGDVCRYRGRMAGLSSVASSISTPGWAANGPFTCSCPGLSQPSNDAQPGSEHFFPLSWAGDGATGRDSYLKTEQRHLWREVVAALWQLPGWRGGTGRVWQRVNDHGWRMKLVRVSQAEFPLYSSCYDRAGSGLHL